MLDYEEYDEAVLSISRNIEQIKKIIKLVQDSKIITETQKNTHINNLAIHLTKLTLLQKKSEDRTSVLNENEISRISTIGDEILKIQDLVNNQVTNPQQKIDVFSDEKKLLNLTLGDIKNEFNKLITRALSEKSNDIKSSKMLLLKIVKTNILEITHSISNAKNSKELQAVNLYQNIAQVNTLLGKIYPLTLPAAPSSKQQTSSQKNESLNSDALKNYRDLEKALKNLRDKESSRNTKIDTHDPNNINKNQGPGFRP